MIGRVRELEFAIIGRSHKAIFSTRNIIDKVSINDRIKIIDNHIKFDNGYNYITHYQIGKNKFIAETKGNDIDIFFEEEFETIDEQLSIV